MNSKTQTMVVELHAGAPGKPDYGAPCNGCGACCAAEPCPVALLFLWQFSGRCRALLWREEERRYVCGMAACPDRYVRWFPRGWRRCLGAFFASRIAAGAGCDFAAEMQVVAEDTGADADAGCGREA